MSSCKITIPITPKPKASVRLWKRGSYNPSARGMKQIADYVRKRFSEKPLPLLKGPILVIVHFVLPAPLSLLQRKRELQNYRPHIKRPDGDNLEKYLNDALTGVVWADDARIAWMLRSKTITSSKEGYTIFYAQEIADDKPDYQAILETIKEHIYIHKEEVND